MPSFYYDVKKIPGKSLLNVYGLFIAKCHNLTNLTTTDEKILHQIEKEIKILFLNHEKNLSTMSFIIKQSLNENKLCISWILKAFLVDVVKSIESFELKAYYRIDNDELDESCLRMDFARRFESEIVVQMLLNPSNLMLDVVQNISNRLIHILKQVDKKCIEESLLKGLGPSDEDSDFPYYAFAFGRFKETPSLDEVLTVLEQNNDLSRVMLIHFLFMRNLFPLLEFHKEFKEKIMQINFYGDLGMGIDKGFVTDYKKLVSFFCRYPDYAPHLYTDRGRVTFIPRPSSSLGIMFDDQNRTNLPSLDVTWYPDCLCNVVDLKSAYVKKLICNYGIPYIAGPSGMTSIFMGLLTFMGEISNTDYANYYILAVTAFIVGGGLHCIHEVLTIPSVRLGLIPGYEVDGKIAGNYNAFFRFFRNDSTIQNNIKLSWNKFINYIESEYPLIVNTDMSSLGSIYDDFTVNQVTNEKESTQCVIF